MIYLQLVMALSITMESPRYVQLKLCQSRPCTVAITFIEFGIWEYKHAAVLCTLWQLTSSCLRTGELITFTKGLEWGDYT